MIDSDRKEKAIQFFHRLNFYLLNIGHWFLFDIESPNVNDVNEDFNKVSKGASSWILYLPEYWGLQESTNVMENTCVRESQLLW